MKVYNLENKDRHIIKRLGYFGVLEYDETLSINSMNAMEHYYMSEMGVRRRQLVVNMSGRNNVVVQAGAMQWMAGNVSPRPVVSKAWEICSVKLSEVPSPKICGQT